MRDIRKLMMLSMFLFAIVLTGCKQNVNFTIYFESNGGTEILSVESEAGLSITMPEDPTKEGYIFDGWYWDNNAFTQPFSANSLLDEPLSTNITVYAKWILEQTSDDNQLITYDIFYELYGGINNQDNPTSFNIDSESIVLSNPTKNGATFAGWYYNPEFAGDSVAIIENDISMNITLYAKWDVEPLQMLWWSDGTEGDVMQTLLDQYQTETGVTIELISVAYYEYEARLATMLSGGEAPALARVTEAHLNYFKANILSLEDVYTPSGFTNLFYNTAGDVISLPMDITANGMFVNTDLLDLYDVNYPKLGDPVWTWAEFETEMLKLKDQVGVTAPGLFDHQGHRFMPLLYQNGVKIWETPYTESNLKSTAAVSVVQMMMDFYDEGFLSTDTYIAKNSSSLFRDGAYGFHVSGNWNVSAYQYLTFNWTVVPMPKGSTRATIIGGKSLAAFDDSGAEQEAKDFIAWMAMGSHHDAYTGGVPYLSPRLGTTVDYKEFAPQYAVFLDEVANTSPVSVQDWLNQVMIPGMYPIINQFVQDIADPNNTKTALQLLTDLEAALKAVAPTS